MLLKTLLDALFPISCLSCKTGGAYLCDRCLQQIPRETGILFSPSALSVSKESSRPYDGGFCGIIPTVNYQNSPVIQKAIHYLKYRRIREIATPLGTLVRDRLLPFIRMNQREWLAVPVPLHPRKARARGFNQNDLIVEAAFSKSTIAIAIKKQNPLKRIRDTKTQTSLKREERLLNVQNSFAAANTDALRNRSIILVDDVATTGATIGAAAEALIAAGAREVWGAVVARD